MKEQAAFSHKSVLLDEVIESLAIKEDGIYVDGTLGGAGHSSKIVERLSTGRLIGIDQDEDAIRAASERLAPFGERVSIVRSNYEGFETVIADLGIDKVDGILLDLGVSSYQLDTPQRGFSYKEDAPLDMRMDQRSALTAEVIVNEYPREEITRILRDYGEEKFAANIARHIEAARQQKRIQTTYELNELIKAAIPAKMRQEGGHPSKRTFQAIRIACNRELEVLEDTIDCMIDHLAPGGRLCIITFHSLEDRIVKNKFKTAEHPCICPPSFPVCTCGRTPKGKVLTRKPILPSEREREENPRAKSAKLRVFEKQ
ncbi:MAG: 16S rRNA (cytosine(1402)-N(4))-methyltransferase RsmH [Lachnospiraceae bacterium]|nr:16S rRNA (cytosine(1402)-N(4))-methyltransferase RsmH [Lachnospiraceae bacterium]